MFIYTKNVPKHEIGRSKAKKLTSHSQKSQNWKTSKKYKNKQIIEHKIQSRIWLPPHREQVLFPGHLVTGMEVAQRKGWWQLV